MKMNEMFMNPPKSYRPAPFYFLNHKLEEGELLRQVGEMDEKGIGGMVLHARHGLLTPYMSEEWFRSLETVIKECHKRGMTVWLYDEDNWPSGTHGGKITREHPEYRMRYLRIEEISLQAAAAGVQLDQDDNTLIAAYAYKLKAGKAAKEMYRKEVTHCISSTGFIDASRVKGIGGLDTVLVFWECPVAKKVSFNNGYYLDTMNEEAVKTFIKNAYQPYERFSPYFGNTIQGVFTDEPGLMIHDGFFGTAAMRTSVEEPQRNLSGYSFAWTREFFSHFEGMKGYDIREKLDSLLYDVRADSVKVRQDYYDVITTLYIRNYHRAIGSWCRDRGLKYIGHTLEEPLWGQARSQGNQTKVLQEFDYPGVDYLGTGVGTKENPYRILSVKCASSAAAIEGKQRVICECFGGSGFKHSLRDRQLDANFMAALGVNLFIPHAFYYSLAAYRKTDWPPTEFYHTPFWPYYKSFSDYIGRLSLIAASGEHAAQIGILSPIHTVYDEMFKNGEAVTDLECDRIFAFISDRLLRYHYDYHYLDEVQLRNSKIQDHRLYVGVRKQGYEVIVLAGSKRIHRETADKIREFVEYGGILLSVGELPEIYLAEEAENDAFRACLSGCGNVRILDFDERIEGEFYQSISKAVCPPVAIGSEDGIGEEDIIVSQRTVEGERVFLLVSRSKDTVRVNVDFASDILYQWNLETGDIARVPNNRGGAVAITFHPQEAKVISTGKNDTHEKIPRRQDCGSEAGSIRETMELKSNLWTFKAGGENVLILDQWNVKLAAKVGTGQTNQWTSGFTVEQIPETLKIVLDTPDQWIPSHGGFFDRKRATEVYINGERLPALKPSTWQDKYYLEQDIKGYTRLGANAIEVETVSMFNPMHGIGHPAYIIGDFSVENGAIVKGGEGFLGYWNHHGYPQYSGVGIYETSLTLDKISPNCTYLLKAGEVKDGMAVKVNDLPAGVRMWPPYAVDLTEYLIAGENRIRIEVFNSLANLYGKAPKDSGLQPYVKIEVRAKTAGLPG